ncbi:LLM class flavin-dependent oxidoreductase [Facklamia sp. P12934]|uniref:LLM class flavin-dependent oxidoreductase n=1 Tax=Facklamia sp. P12934 TaxID=3421948 RepID=UPI003D16AFBC
MNSSTSPKKPLEIGIYTLGDHVPHPITGDRISQEQRVNEIIRYGIEAEAAGLDLFSVGESHQPYFTSQAHTVILAAIAQATSKIKLSSAATIVSTSDPVRIFEDFATLDLISKGRMEIIAGRASRVGLFDLLGYNMRDYEALFEEKFELLRQINEDLIINWEGEFRAPLKNASILPRPYQNRKLTIWRAVGGHRTSAIQAGRQGAPIFLAHLTGPVDIHLANIQSYREALEESGYQNQDFPVATAGMLYVAETSQKARQEAYTFISKGFTFSNGQEFPKRAFAQSENLNDILNVGSPQEIVEKILYQYETFGISRYVAQIDFGGIPFEHLMKNLELLEAKVLPAVRRYTGQKAADQAEPTDHAKFRETVQELTKEKEVE